MITFNNQDIGFSLKQKSIIKKWIIYTLEKKKRKAGNINFIFCSDESLLKINQDYLNHDTYTDIITFDYTENQLPLKKGAGGISGDIFISIDRVKENAKKFSKSFDDELHRVIIHGILHLLGYTDKTKLAKAEMTKQEDACLKLFLNRIHAR